MTNPKKNGDLMLRVRYDSGAELAGPAVITDEGALLVSLGGAASMLVQRADGSLPPHITFVDIRPSHVGYGLPLTDDKVMRRQGRTGWMRPDDPRRAAYAPDNWFGPDRRERLLVHDLGRRFTIRWNAELVARLDALDADKWWLSTWQPETAQLNRALGVD